MNLFIIEEIKNQVMLLSGIKMISKILYNKQLRNYKYKI